MLDSTILTITNDNRFLTLFRRRFHDQVAGGSRMIVAPTIDEACSLLKTVQPRLIVVHWTGGNGRYELLDRLLWTTTVQARQIPVLVIAERYRTDQATMMYRMGVVDYISRTHHLDQLAAIFAAYLPATMVPAEVPVLPEAAVQSAKGWTAGHEAAAVASRAV